MASPLASKMRGVKLRAGQAVRLETPGGGGFGLGVERTVAWICGLARANYKDIDRCW